MSKQLIVDLKKLVEAGVQWGHQTWRWCPKMSPYIWGKKNGVHLINVQQTANKLKEACDFIEEAAQSGKQVLFVGTKSAAQESVKAAAKRINQPYVVTRWLGGLLTNLTQVMKSVSKFLRLQKNMKDTQESSYTKKERMQMQKSVDRMQPLVEGIVDLKWPIAAVVVIDPRKEHVAIKEAIAEGIPVVALVDTNTDPKGVDFVIPGNDDGKESIALIINILADAFERGAKNAKAAEAKETKINEEKAATLQKRTVKAKSADRSEEEETLLHLNTDDGDNA